jgi:branched-subunit amino acid transport protein
MTGTIAGWLTVAAVGVATIAIKAAGPVILGGRPLPDRFAGVVALLAPALLAALVATSAIASGQALTIDARLIGVAAAVVALVLRAPTLVVVLVAAAAAALARTAGIA